MYSHKFGVDTGYMSIDLKQVEQCFRDAKGCSKHANFALNGDLPTRWTLEIMFDFLIYLAF